MSKPKKGLNTRYALGKDLRCGVRVVLDVRSVWLKRNALF